MVQIIPRTRATPAEQLMGGLQSGVSQGFDLARQLIGQSAENKLKQKTIAEKLKLLESPEYEDLFEKMDPRYKKLFQLGAAGAIEPGALTSAAEMIRQDIGQNEFNKYFGTGTEGNQNIVSSDFNASIPSEDNVSPSISPPKKSSTDNFQSKIDNIEAAMEKIRPALQSQNKAVRDTATASMNDLNNRLKNLHTQMQMQQSQKTTYTKLNEPRIEKLSDRIRSQEENQLHFDRLNKIVTEEGDKLPSTFTAAMFDPEGEGGLSKLARSQLSEPAQEFLKLIVDMINGAQGTYGGKVSNFEANQYLKRLPGLLNSPEGKKRVLRDLSLLNQMNLLHDQAINEEFENAGGSGSIAYSDAENSARKRIKPIIDDLKDEFINPKKKNYSSLPQASRFKGKRIKDNTTGEIFISDGENWVRENEIL